MYVLLSEVKGQGDMLSIQNLVIQALTLSRFKDRLRHSTNISPA